MAKDLFQNNAFSSLPPSGKRVIEQGAQAQKVIEELELFEGISEPFNYFLKYIGRFPILTPEKEEELFERLKADPSDRRARKTIIECNLRLIVWVLKTMVLNHRSLNSLEPLDLCQEGYFGLVTAMERFKVESGNKFSTYAIWWIWQAITRAISDRDDTVRLPVHVQEQLSMFNRAERKLFQEFGREPTSEELAREMNTEAFDKVAERIAQKLGRQPNQDELDEIREVTPEKVANLKRARALKSLIALESPLLDDGDPGDTTFGDIVPDPDEDIQAFAENEQMRELTLLALAQLNPKEKKILCLRFGLEDDITRTLEEVGKEFGVTRERIRQIEAKALEKLRFPKGKARTKTRRLRDFIRP